MKKTLKKLTALLLSLVMVLGCIPSFVNEVSAAFAVTLAFNKPANKVNLETFAGAGLGSFSTHEGVTAATLTVQSLAEFTHDNKQIEYEAAFDNYYMLISELTLSDNVDNLSSIKYGSYGEIKYNNIPEWFTEPHHCYDWTQGLGLRPRWEKTADNKIKIYELYNFNNIAYYNFTRGRRTDSVAFSLTWGGQTYNNPTSIIVRRSEKNTQYQELTEPEKFKYFDNDTQYRYYISAKFENVTNAAQIGDMVNIGETSRLSINTSIPNGGGASWYRDNNDIYIGLDMVVMKTEDNLISLVDYNDGSDADAITLGALNVLNISTSLPVQADTQKVSVTVKKDDQPFTETFSKDDSYKVILEVTDKSAFGELDAFTSLNDDKDDFILDTDGNTDWNVSIDSITSTLGSYKIVINLEPRNIKVIDVKVQTTDGKEVTIGDSMNGNSLVLYSSPTTSSNTIDHAASLKEDWTPINPTGQFYKDKEYILEFNTSDLADFNVLVENDPESIKLGEDSSKCVTKVEWDKANSKLYVTYKPQFKSFKFKMYIDGTEVTKIPDGTQTNKITFKLTGPSGDINLTPTYSPSDDPIDKTKDYTVTLTGTTTHTEVGETIEGFTYDETLSGNRTFKSGNSITPYYDLKFNLPVLGGNLVELTDFTSGKKPSEVSVTRLEVIDGEENVYSSDLSDVTLKIYDSKGYEPTGDSEIQDNMDFKIEIISEDPSSFKNDGTPLTNFTQVDDASEITFKGLDPWFIKNPTITKQSGKIVIKADLSAKKVSSFIINGSGDFEVGSNPNFTFSVPEDAKYTIVDDEKLGKWYKENTFTTSSGEIEADTLYYSPITLKLKDGYTPSAGGWGVFSTDAYVDDDMTYNSALKTIKLTLIKSASFDFNLTRSDITTKEDVKYIAANPGTALGSPSGLEAPTFSFGPLGDSYSDYTGLYQLSYKIKCSDELESKLKNINMTSLKSIKFNGHPVDIGTDDLPQAVKDAMISGEDPIPAYINYFLSGNYFMRWGKEAGGSYKNDSSLNLRVPQFTITEVVDLGKDGYVNFTNIAPGLERSSVVAEGNLDTNGTFNPSDLEVEMWNETLATPEWSTVEDPHYVFEAGKRYRITYKAVNTKYDMTNIKINGTPAAYTKSESYPEETGVAYSYENTSDFVMKITYEFTAQTPSSGSKKYKANDPDNNVDKITGTGKKGSKRIVFPEPNRKVKSVIVTDKKGNRYEVTNEGDGTYSFIQPGCDVDVEINYKLRLIELTIGSLNAYVDSELNMLDVVPQVRNDRTMLPIRFVAENLGAKVDWAENDPDTVWITRGDIKIEITLGSDIAKVNGKEYKLDAVAFAENDRTYLPVRFVSENLNAIVEWNEANPMDVKIYER